jgi:hypothetical protein
VNPKQELGTVNTPCVPLHSWFADQCFRRRDQMAAS